MFKALRKIREELFGSDEQKPVEEKKVAPPSRLKPEFFCSEEELATKAAFERAQRKAEREKRRAEVEDPIRAKYGIPRTKS